MRSPTPRSVPAESSLTVQALLFLMKMSGTLVHSWSPGRKAKLSPSLTCWAISLLLLRCEEIIDLLNVYYNFNYHIIFSISTISGIINELLLILSTFFFLSQVKILNRLISIINHMHACESDTVSSAVTRKKSLAKYIYWFTFVLSIILNIYFVIPMRQTEVQSFFGFVNFLKIIITIGLWNLRIIAPTILFIDCCQTIGNYVNASIQATEQVFQRYSCRDTEMFDLITIDNNLKLVRVPAN